MLRSNQTVLVLSLSAFGATGCGTTSLSKPTQQSPSQATPQSSSPSPADPAATAEAGTLAIDNGTVALSVNVLSTASSFTAANATTANLNKAAHAGSLAVATTLALDASTAAGSTSDAPAFHAYSIASGPPDGFKISVTRIALRTEPSAQPTVLFDLPAGAELAVDSGTLSLGALATSLPAPVGIYKELEISVLREAHIKGCVEADYQQPGGSVTGAANVTGVHKYCTVSGFSGFDDPKANGATFEQTPAEFMSFDLGAVFQVDSAAHRTDTVGFKYPLNPPLTVTKDASFDLSLVLDLNRVLRFYNRNRVDQGPNPSAPTDRPYFFNSIFAQSFYAFAGKPGRIYGYELIASNCPKASADLTTFACSTPGAVGAWMTVITDPQGAPLVVSVNPNDDNDLTILKGGINGLSPFLTAGTVAGRVDLSYALSYGERLGVLHNFEADLESVAVGGTMAGVSFEATPSVGNEQVGTVYVRRGL